MKAREQQRQPRVIVVSQLDNTKDIMIPAVEYNHFLPFKEAHQPPSFIVVAQSGNPVAFVSTSYLGPWVLNFGASIHLIGNKYLLSHLSYSNSFPFVSVA